MSELTKEQLLDKVEQLEKVNADFVKAHAALIEENEQLRTDRESLIEKIENLESKLEPKSEPAIVKISELKEKWEFHLDKPFKLDSFLDYFQSVYPGVKDLKKVDKDHVELIY